MLRGNLERRFKRMKGKEDMVIVEEGEIEGTKGDGCCHNS